MVLFLSGISLFALAGALRWSSSNVSLADRHNNYFNTFAIADAAAEKVITRMSRDFHVSGRDYVETQLGTYRGIIPTSAETSLLGTYRFYDSTGVANQTSVDKLIDWAFNDVQSHYPGLKGSNATFRIGSKVQTTNGLNRPFVNLQRTIKLASVPLFSFGVYYSQDLEINPSADLALSGRIHSNGSIYSQAQGKVTYNGDVTATKAILRQAHPQDPTARSAPNTVTYARQHDPDVKPFLVPIGTNNTPVLLRALVEVPPASESTSSAMGLQRFYNKSDLIILVSNGTSVARCGGSSVPWTNVCDTVVTNSSTNYVYTTNTVSTGKGAGKGGKKKGTTTTVSTTTNTQMQLVVVERLISTNGDFFDKRENRTAAVTEIDIEYLRTNSYFRAILGRDVKSIYVGDFRTASGTFFGIRLVNGEVMPSLGLTVATPNPLYIEGNYNAPTAYLGTTNTSTTLPAAIACDAVTLLSDNWDDNDSSTSITNSVATNTTVNAAIISGILPSGGGYYSGGLERIFRFQEDWSGKTFTFNGSIAVLYNSQIAIQPDQANPQIYLAPTKKWSFDQNFLDVTKLPPVAPYVRSIIASPQRIATGN